jgi:hypothetical protein
MEAPMPLRLLILAPLLALALGACSASEEPRTLAGPTVQEATATPGQPGPAPTEPRGATAQPSPAATATATATRPGPSATATPAAGNEAARGTPSTGSPGATPTKPAANCDPSYPAVCIPPPPPDLDCKDIPDRRFKVAGADPHRFDSDRDGIGCES